MRLDAKDPGSDNYDVTLDGVPQKNCLWADEERGQIQRFKLDASGNVLHRNGGFISETVTGVVKIISRFRHNA